MVGSGRDAAGFNPTKLVKDGHNNEVYIFRINNVLYEHNRC